MAQLFWATEWESIALLVFEWARGLSGLVSLGLLGLFGCWGCEVYLSWCLWGH